MDAAGFELLLTPSKLLYYAALALSESGRAAEVKPGLQLRSVPQPGGVVATWGSAAVRPLPVSPAT